MKNEQLIVGRDYFVLDTEGGQWFHSPGSDFLFAFAPEKWDPGTKKQVVDAFKSALSMSTTIKKAVEATSHQTVVQGLYLEDQSSMTDAMNSIEGMGMTSANQGGESGQGTATSINAEFFAAILGGLGGDIAPIMGYLNSQMANIQVQTGKTTVTKNFGTVIGMISVMPELDVVTTTFQYVFSGDETSHWFVNTNCGSHEQYSYDYTYTAVEYNYDPS